MFWLFEAPDQSLVSPAPHNCLAILLVVVTIVPEEKNIVVRNRSSMIMNPPLQFVPVGG